jgi:hypothetical protein
VPTTNAIAAKAPELQQVMSSQPVHALVRRLISTSLLPLPIAIHRLSSARSEAQASSLIPGSHPDASRRLCLERLPASSLPDDAMNRLPPELIDAILLQCVASGPKNAILSLRHVCRTFNRILKPFICRTLGLEFSRLSRTSRQIRPQMDALQTIGYHCKSLYIDLMVVRDESETRFQNLVSCRT